MVALKASSAVMVALKVFCRREERMFERKGSLSRRHSLARVAVPRYHLVMKGMIWSCVAILVWVSHGCLRKADGAVTVSQKEVLEKLPFCLQIFREKWSRKLCHYPGLLLVLFFLYLFKNIT